MGTLVVYAKAPWPGRVKTRLSPFLSPVEAAEVYQFSLQAVVERLESADIHPQIWFFEEWDRRGLEGLFPGRILRPQKGGDLGERMYHTFTTLLEEGETSVFILGSDAPTLPVEFLQEGIRLLENHDCVLGPTQDGGYYAIGLRHIDRRIFSQVSWSLPTVLERTIANIESLHGSYRLLPRWYDIDHPGDLAVAWGDLENLSDRTVHQEKLRACLAQLFSGERRTDGTS